MDTAPDIPRTTDWSRTLHAYGPGTDAPACLAGLRSEREWERAAALGHLYSTVPCQGTVCPVTPPAVRYVADLLSDPAADRRVHGVFDGSRRTGAAPLRQHLLRFLADVAWSVAETCGGCSDAEPDALADPGERRGELEPFLERVAHAEGSAEGGTEGGAVDVWEDPLLTPLPDILMNTALRDLRRAAPELLEAVRPLLTHRDRGVRQRAVTAAGALSRMGGGAAPDLSGAADCAESRDDGAAIVLALVDSGGDTTEFLTHQDPAIRACAALSPALAGDPGATAELRRSLLAPAGADAWFGDRPAYFEGHVRFSLVKALVERSGPADAPDLLPVFQALTAAASASTAERDLGGLLRLALDQRGRRAAAPVEHPTRTQRAYLCALVGSDGLWGPGSADFAFLLERLGLPPDRETMRSLAESS